jgi:uncharacterized SAM-binding protein YcdF (DUF218 family)
VLALVVATHPLTARALIGALEREMPAPMPPRDVQAIVVLSGWMRPGPDSRRELGEDSLLRTLHAAALYRELGPRLVVATGGPSRGAPGGGSIAAQMSQLLVALGVPRRDILVEGESRTTFENALLTRRLLEPRGIVRILLVTDGMHLPRAVRAFRTQGFQVVPAGCGYVTSWTPPLREMILPSANAAVGVQRAAHEWVGLLWYRLRGYIR